VHWQKAVEERSQREEELHEVNRCVCSLGRGGTNHILVYFVPIHPNLYLGLAENQASRNDPDSLSSFYQALLMLHRQETNRTKHLLTHIPTQLQMEEEARKHHYMLSTQCVSSSCMG